MANDDLNDLLDDDKGSEDPKPAKKKGVPYIKALFLVAAIGTAGLYGANYAGYPEPLEKTSKAIVTASDKVWKTFEGTMQPLGPVLERSGFAVKVPASQRAVVTFGGNLNGLGFVADPGYRLKLPWHDEPVFYPIGQQMVKIDKNSKEEPITTATKKGQSVEDIRLDGLWHIKGDALTLDAMDDTIKKFHIKAGVKTNKDGTIDSDDRKYEKIIYKAMLNAHKDVFGKITITNLDPTKILEMMAMGSGNAAKAVDFDKINELLSANKAKAEKNLMERRPDLNKRMVARANEILTGTELAGLVEVDQIMLTNFDFTKGYDDATDAIAEAEAKFLEEQANIQVRLAIKRQTIIDAEAQKEKAILEAQGEAARIEEPGMAAARVITAKVEAAGGDISKLTENEKWTKAWKGGGWSGPQTLATGGAADAKLLLTPDLKTKDAAVAPKSASAIFANEAAEETATPPAEESDALQNLGAELGDIASEILEINEEANNEEVTNDEIAFPKEEAAEPRTPPGGKGPAGGPK